MGQDEVMQTPRILRDHQINSFNRDNVLVTVLDGPGQGGACHHYRIHLNLAKNATLELTDINFQNGPVKEAGVNGLTEESLIAIVLDRLRAFQRGPYSTRENACALTHFEEGLMWLQQRTINRERRGVEGTNKP
jgi:hypothetical protein